MTLKFSRALQLICITLAVAVPALAQTKAAAATSAGAIPKVEFERYTLPNGLDVILHVDRQLAIDVQDDLQAVWQRVLRELHLRSRRRSGRSRRLACKARCKADKGHDSEEQSVQGSHRCHWGNSKVAMAIGGRCAGGKSSPRPTAIVDPRFRPTSHSRRFDGAVSAVGRFRYWDEWWDEAWPGAGNAG